MADAGTDEPDFQSRVGSGVVTAMCNVLSGTTLPPTIDDYNATMEPYVLHTQATADRANAYAAAQNPPGSTVRAPGGVDSRA